MSEPCLVLPAGVMFQGCASDITHKPVDAIPVLDFALLIQSEMIYEVLDVYLLISDKFLPKIKTHHPIFCHPF